MTTPSRARAPAVTATMVRRVAARAPGRRERADLVGRLAAHQADRHGQDGEGEGHAGGGGDGADRGERPLLVAGLDGEPGVGGHGPRRADLRTGERLGALDEPPGRAPPPTRCRRRAAGVSSEAGPEE